MLTATEQHDIDAEINVVGGLLVDGKKFFEIVSVLNKDDFYRAAHRWIFEAMHTLAQADEPIDMMSVRAQLVRMKLLDEVGGWGYLNQITNEAVSLSKMTGCAKNIRDMSRVRKIGNIAREIIEHTLDPGTKADAALANAERLIFSCAAASSENRDPVNATTLTAGYKELLEARKNGTIDKGLKTGYHELDDKIGLKRGEFTIIAARPSMGKSAFALNLAANLADKQNVLFFSLEMSKESITDRLVSSVGGIGMKRLASGETFQSDGAVVDKAIKKIGEFGLHVDDTFNLSAIDLRGKARRFKATKPLGLVVVDYIQLMKIVKAENQNLAIADISRSLKMMAHELDVPVVALSQLSRELERRPEKRPIMSDLRDSGALEQDADIIMFIYRDEVYNPNNAESKGLAEVIVAKNRNGETGTVNLRWDPFLVRFANFDGSQITVFGDTEPEESYEPEAEQESLAI